MINFSKRKRVAELSKLQLLIRSVVSIAIIAVLTGGWSWWHFVHSNPTRVFWHAVDNALQSPSFSRETVQGGAGQSFDQNLLVATSPKQIAEGTDDVTQSGQSAFHVITGEAGSPTSDFVKYDYVKTGQLTASGKSQDFKSILGIWGTTSGTNSTVTDGQLYNQSVLGVLPFGNLSLDQRKELIKVIKANKVYQVDYLIVLRLNVRGRPTYTYDVTVSAESYIVMLKKYASIVRLTQLAKTNPADFKDTAPLNFKFVIDVWTNQITRISYSGSQRDEFYGNIGIHLKHTDLPKKAIPINELQQRIRALEQ